MVVAHWSDALTATQSIVVAMAKSPVVMTEESLVGAERTMEKICGPVANYADT
jgi:hypothetical protein